MVKFEYVLDKEKDLKCLEDYYFNSKESKKNRLVIRSSYLILALLLGIFTDLYLAVVCLVVLIFFLPELIQKKKLKKYFLSDECNSLYENKNYTISENGVVIETSDGIKEYSWDEFVEYSFFEDCLYIVRNGGALILFNKEGMDKDNFEQVLELVQKNIVKKDI